MALNLIIEIVGWSAAGVLLGAYAMLSRGLLSGQGSPFQTLNVVGSLLVGVNSFMHEAWPSASVNLVWLVIGVATLTASRRARQRTAQHPAPADDVRNGDDQGLAVAPTTG